jgi:glucosamine--fructose-6-phosphate aminotransferase (isomerizing)
VRGRRGQPLAIVGDGAPDQAADHTARVCPNETAGTFSVSYLASLAALARMAAPFEAAGDAFARALPKLPDVIARTLALTLPPATALARLAEAQVLLVVGFGGDFPTAQETALKLKEGAWIWSEAMSPEFALHGTPAGFRPGLAALLIEPADGDGGRTAVLRGVLDRLGLGPVMACGEAHGDGPDLAFAPPPHPLLRPMLAILPFHRVTAELARLRGTDPDTLHGNREPWREIMTGLRL